MVDYNKKQAKYCCVRLCYIKSIKAGHQQVENELKKSF